MVIHLFGDRLRELRKEKKISQEKLGEFLGVTSTAIYSWEINRTQPPFETVKLIAEYFNVSSDYLLGIDKDDLDAIERLNKALREAGMVDSDETLKEEEIKLAIDQARQYKQMFHKLNGLEMKYPEGSIKQSQVNSTKDTNE